MQASWFMVHVKPRKADLVCKRFEDIGVTTFLPQLLVHRRHGSQRWHALGPLFLSYVLARFVPDGSLVYRLSCMPTAGGRRSARAVLRADPLHACLERVIDEPVAGTERVRVLLDLGC